MIVIDTNIILRYLLNDNEELSKQAIDIIDNNTILIPNEVIVEACYVLRKVYNVEKEKIYEAVQSLMEIDNINFQNTNVVSLAFKTYATQNLDIVDCILYSYNRIEKYEVKTFDKKLNKLISG
ncbi:MAG: type II toxin-antitoxin system VapC family toxin [Clostridia bacterium]|nr:type II toxin-antitoxin system VapC family toxin [Clostridia bacterium]